MWQVRPVVGDHLHGPPVDHGKDRAQDLVPADDLAKGRDERIDVDRAANADGRGHVVGGALGRELMEEPHPLLGKRQGRRADVSARPDRQGRRRAPVAEPAGDALGQPGHGGRLEQVAHREVHLKGLLDARNDLRGQERVAAELEEAVMDADVRALQHLRPDPGDRFLEPGARRGDQRAALERRPGGGGEGATVHLAARGHGQRVEEHEIGWDHVRGKARPEKDAEILRGRRDLLISRDQAPDQFLSGIPVCRRQHDGRANGRMRLDDGLDLPELDAVAADLHLGVEASEILEPAIGAIPRQIAGPVAALARDPRVSVEGPRGLLGTVQVAPRHLDSGDPQLARHADRDRLPARVQHVRPDIGDGAANGQERLTIRDPLRRRVHRRFGRPVLVPQLRTSLEQQPRPHPG